MSGCGRCPMCQASITGLPPISYRDVAACVAVLCGIAAAWLALIVLVMAAWRVVVA